MNYIFNYLHRRNLSKLNKEDLNTEFLNILRSDTVNIEDVKYFIELNVNINAFRCNGKTPLIYAFQNNRADIVELLIKHGALVNIPDNSGSTALIWACKEGYIDIVRLLIDAGADVNIKTYTGITAIMWACNKGYIDIVRLLIENGADTNIITHENDNNNNNENDNINTALTMAYKQNHIDIVILILDSEKNPNEKKNKIYTISKLICINIKDIWKNLMIPEYMDLINYLITKKNIHYGNLFILACKYHNVSLVKFILNYTSFNNFNDTDIQNNNALILACCSQKNNVELVRSLLDIGININHRNNNGYNAFLMACKYNNLNLVELLLKYNLDLNKSCSREYTGLILLCRSGTNPEKSKIVYDLIKKGVNIHITDKRGLNALMWAYITNNHPLIRILLEYKASTYISDILLYTDTFLWACHKGYVFIVKLLLEYNININIRDSCKRTGLIIACKNKKVNVIKLLLEKGIWVNSQDIFGNTALMYSVKYKSSYISQLLLKYGADIHIKNKLGDSAFTLATKENKINIF